MQTKNKTAQKNQLARKGLSLNAKLLGTLIPIIVITLCVILLLVYTNTSKILLEKSEENLSLSTKSAINSVTAWTNKVLTALDQQKDILQFSDYSQEQELDYIKHTANQFEAFPAGIYLGLKTGSLTHASFVPAPEYNVFEKSWYNDGLKAENFMLGAIYFDEDSQSYVVGASGVLKSKLGTVRGVAAADIYLTDISNIVAQVKIEETGGLFLVDNDTGMIIGHNNPAFLGKILSEQESSMYTFADKHIKEGTSGLQLYSSSNGEIYLDIETVPNTRWTAVSYVPANEILKELNTLTQFIIAVAVASVLILMAIIIFLLRRVVIRPVRQIDGIACQIASGNLNQTITYKSSDELGELAGNFNKTVARLKDYVNYINEISYVLEQIAAGNLQFKLTYDYQGEFEKIKTALEHISLSLNDTLGQINISAEQVSEGAAQVSSGAQALSQSSSEQAASVEELAATMTEVSTQVYENARRAGIANQRAESVSVQVLESNRRMSEMLTSMSDISVASSEIGKIIKTIEDIAFQTNILALNAAVEAARAGAAGKGFAVVADEVRNLANKSQTASKNTAALIENSLLATEKGTHIANETASALESVVEGVNDVTKVIAEITKATNEQAESISNVNNGIEQISSVVQTNSATAEQSAAASETLSAQSETVKMLVDKFKFNKM